MKLLVYNKENTSYFAGKNGERTVRFNRSNGTIYFSRGAAEEIGLKELEKVFFVNDEDNKKDWYFSKTSDKSGFSLKNDNGGIRFISKFLSTKILDALKIEVNATFLIAKEAIEVDGNRFYRIITSSPIAINTKRAQRKTIKKGVNYG